MPRRLLASVLLALAASCAVLPPPAADARPQRESIAAFGLSGRIAVRHAGETHFAGIEWRHDGETDEIVLSGPLGQGLARLTAGGGAALLETADGKRYAAADLDGLAAQVFGAPIPVSGLSRWVLGRAAVDGQLRRDAAGRPVALVEQGWTIEYLRFESAAPQALPDLLRARRGDTEVRLTIDGWELPR
ncbi:MAG TPA: lipoprotein insertase outer membrane protein LolB [Candidatus Desulfobacillus sp.]|nr:lipoprotein insertase outer membrane protein LolB [Candidatus Desulfobacillus sp.]